MMKMPKLIILLSVIGSVMFAFSFAISPLYNHFCRLTGINTATTEKEFFSQEDARRKITIQFLTTNNEKLVWEFFPRQNSLTVHPHQLMKIFFHIKNTTQHGMTVQAIPSFSPGLAGAYFHKLECFCFTQQFLAPGEEKEMPVVFQIDEKLPREINTITLAYTLFDVTKEIG